MDVFLDERAMTVAVEDDKLSLAIGKNGQNARLASRLTGWKINIMSETDYNNMKRREAEMMVPIGMLSGVGDVLEERLVEADITTVQDLAKATVEDLMEIEGIGEKIAERLIVRAQEYVVEVEEKRRREEEEAAAAEEAAEAIDAEPATAESDETGEVSRPEPGVDNEDERSKDSAKE
jgi:N utilization substance protein A